MFRNALSAFVIVVACAAPVVTEAIPKAVVVDVAPHVKQFTEAGKSTNLLPFDLSAVRLRRGQRRHGIHCATV